MAKLLELQTSRLIIRDMQVQDISTYIHFQMMPEMKKYRQCFETPELAQWQTEQWIENNHTPPSRRKSWLMTIIEKDTNTMIGDLHLMAWTKKDAHISYGLDPKFWRRGYMSEALACVTEFAHNTAAIKKIQEPVLAANTASWRIMEKCGYQRIAEKLVVWDNPGIRDAPTYLYQSVPR